MKTSPTARLVSFAFATAVTLAMLAGMDALALSDAPAGLIARVQAAFHA